MYKNSFYLLEIYTKILMCEKTCQKFTFMYSSEKQNNKTKELRKLESMGDNEVKLVRCWQLLKLFPPLFYVLNFVYKATV